MRGDPPRRTIRRGNGGGDFTAREITLFDVFALLLRQRYLIISIGLAWLVLTLAAVISTQRTFTSGVTFASPQTDPGLGGLSGVAAQLGLRVPTGQATTHTRVEVMDDLNRNFSHDLGNLNLQLKVRVHQR